MDKYASWKFKDCKLKHKLLLGAPHFSLQNPEQPTPFQIKKINMLSRPCQAGNSARNNLISP